MSTTRIYDFRELLEFLTGQAWREIEDLDSDYGRDYYYCTEDDSEAYIRAEENRLKIVVDGETLFEGRIDDDYVRVFVNRRAPPQADGQCDQPLPD